jgi:PAS domain S-box-containing protein
VEERLAFETLLSDLSARFVNVPADQLDKEILDAQRRICECLDLDASALWQNETGTSNTYVLTHVFLPPGGPSVPERMDAAQYFPWCLKLLLAGKHVIVSSLDDLPPEAAPDVESWKYFGIKTSLTFPLSAGGGPIFGFLSFNDVQKERDWPDSSVKRLRLVTQIFANALERKRVEMALRESEELSRSTFEQAAVGIAHVATDGHWLRVNDRLCSILGYSKQELLQLSFQDITYPEDLETNLEQMHQLLSGKIETYSMEKRYLRKDGSTLWANLTVSLVWSAVGDPKYFISVVEDITARKQAEDALRQLSGRLITAQEQERAWIAKELHDGISQHLALFSIELNKLKDNPPGQPEIGTRLEKLHRRAFEMLDDVRRLSHGLHPSLLEHLGLVSALNSFCRETEKVTGISIRFTARNVPRDLSQDVSLCLYRVAQESLQNVVKHSGAHRVTVDIVVEADELRMRIADDGKGFDLQSARATDSLGLVGMRERIGLVQGKMKLEAIPGQGTVVDVWVPLIAQSVR